MNLIVAVSLFGEDPKYTQGAIACAEELGQIDLGELSARLVIYFDDSVPAPVINRLSSFDQVSLVRLEGNAVGNGTLASSYRFLAFDEFRDEGDVILTWDVDNRIDGYFRAVVAHVLAGESLFSALRKPNPPRQRPFNADCWAAVPVRSKRYPTFSNQIARETKQFIEAGVDTTYGCDERLMGALLRSITSSGSAECRLLTLHGEALCDDHTSTMTDYPGIQRAN